MGAKSGEVVRRATLRDHLGHHPGTYNWRNCRPLLLLGQQKFRGKTTKTTPFGSKREEVKERARTGAGCGVEEGESIKTVFKMGPHSKSPSCLSRPRHTCKHGEKSRVLLRPTQRDMGGSSKRMGLLRPTRSAHSYWVLVFSTEESSHGPHVLPVFQVVAAHPRWSQ